MKGFKRIMDKLSEIYNRKDNHYFIEDEKDSYYFREGPTKPLMEEKRPEPVIPPKVSATPSSTNEVKYEVLEREIAPRKIICPDCGGITLEGLEFCDKCGGEINPHDIESE